MLRWDGGKPVTSRPAMRMRPPSAGSSPAIRRSVVDLPQPEGPSSTLSVPSSNSNESPSTARTLPSTVVQCLLTFSAAMADTMLRFLCDSPLVAADDSTEEERSAEELLERRARIRRAHERLADEERVDA